MSHRSSPWQAPSSVSSGDLKSGQRSLFGHQSLTMIEPGSNGIALGRGLAEHGAEVLNVFPVAECAGSTGEAQAHVEFVGWMNVGRIADVDGDCHGGIAQRQSANLLLAELMPSLQPASK